MNLFGKRLGGTNKCSKCGNKLDTDSLFCLKCGTPINPGDDGNAASEEKVDGKKKCPGCSAMVEEESDLCWNCGYIFATLLKRCPKCNAILTSGTDKCSVCDTVVICEEPKKEEPKIAESVSVIEKVEESVAEKITVEAKPETEDAPVLHSSVVKSSVKADDITEEERKAASKYFHKPPAL